MIDFHRMERLRQALIEARGRIAFLALFEREDRRGRLDLLVAGGGLEISRAGYQVIADAVEKTLLPEDRMQIARWVIVPEDDESVVEVRQRAQVNGSGPVELRDFEYYQFTIRRAWIFHAEPVEVGAARA